MQSQPLFHFPSTEHLFGDLFANFEAEAGWHKGKGLKGQGLSQVVYNIHIKGA